VPFRARLLTVVLSVTYALVLLSFALPEIRLDGRVADASVWVSDTAYWTYMPILCGAVIVVVVSRPGIGIRRRGVEAAVMTVALLVAVAANALLNENVIKPAFAVPRPNIEALAGDGALGPGVETPEDFYALGDKDARRQFLGPQLADLDEPVLSTRVEEHWAHETGYAFPSGHSTAALTFATLTATLGVWWLRSRRLWVATLLIPVWAVLVVYSRVLLGVHTPLDVVVGSAVGIGWGLLASLVVLRLAGWLADSELATSPGPPGGPDPGPSASSGLWDA